MSLFSYDLALKIGVVFEVAGGKIKIALGQEVVELTRTHGGRTYSVGQIGSILKLHLGRRLIFASVSLLRLQTDEEAAALSQSRDSFSSGPDKRIIEADLLGEASWNQSTHELFFKRGVTSYPLPLQPVLLLTQEETTSLFESAEAAKNDGINRFISIGEYVGTNSVACRANVDTLFGQHCAILGSTGSGKSSAVAAVLRSVIEAKFAEHANSCPRIIVIDPHGEYAAAFPRHAKVFRAYDALAQGDVGASNLDLPYWLMSGDEFRSLVIGKTEFEATTQANIVYKALAHARMVNAGLVESALGEIPNPLPEGNVHCDEPVPCAGIDPAQIASFDRDLPRPFKLDEFHAHIVNRQAKRLNGGAWVDIAPSDFQKEYASLLNKFRVLRGDARIQFMMREIDNNGPSLASVFAQFLTVGPNGEECVKIIDISGLPTEVAGPLAGSIARLLFQYKLFQSRSERELDPILLVCEEAHRYVPDRGEAQYAVAQLAIRRIAREGRKYGLGLMLVSQRPSDIEGTVISQCNSWLVLRLSNSSDQAHVARFLPDSLSGMTQTLSSLPRQEALFVGEAAALPARVRLRTLLKEQLPDSNDISFAQGWSSGPLTAEQITAITNRMS